MADLPGFSARTTSRGHRVVTLDYYADPARGDEWLEEARKRSTSMAEFERNVLRNWNISGGATVYPEFAEVGIDAYTFEPPSLLRLPVIRGWDFGYRAPVCVWLQYTLKSDRVYVLREFAPRGIAAHHFRDVCRYLSGKMVKRDLEPGALEWIEMLDSFPGGPRSPWFPPDTTFVDYAGPEVNNIQSIAAKDPHEATLRRVWGAGGIEFDIQAGPVRARTTVLRRFLHMRADGRPGILVSPHCPEVLAMLNGGLTFKKKTQANPEPEEPRKDGRHDNTHDALTYALVAVAPPEGVPGVTPGMEEPAGDDEIGWTP